MLTPLHGSILSFRTRPLTYDDEVMRLF